MSPKLKRIYFFIQGVAVLVWWVVLLLVPEMQKYFLQPGADSLTITAFIPADVILVGLGSLYCAARWPKLMAVRVAWLMAGAIWYLTTYLFVLHIWGELPIHGPFGMTAISSAMIAMLSKERGPEGEA